MGNVFIQTERYNRASALLNNMDDDLKIVSFSTATFAIELYYKVLYCKTTGNDPRKANHDIVAVFRGLTNVVQEGIKRD